jgi:hypothetical protein
MVQAVSRQAEVMEPRYYGFVRWPRVLKSPKAPSRTSRMGRRARHLRGRRAWHVPTAGERTWASLRVLPGTEVSVTKPNQREYRNDAEEVRWVIGPGKRENARGGKAPGQHPPGRGHVVRPAESQTTTATQLTRIAWLSARDTQKPFQSLMPHFHETSLKACFHQLDGRKAVGGDGVTKAA